MKKLFTCAFIALVLAVHCYGQVQNTAVERMVAQLKKFNTNHAREKAYLQFDKPYYAAGDTIYFKAYVTAGEQHTLSNISGILHVDLINPANQVNRSLILKLNNGLAWGDFELPDSLQNGNYRIRAYTRWMQNENNSFFEQSFPIASLKNNVVYENAQSQKQVSLADVQFFPEGGSMVTDIRSKIAFKAIGNNGLGTDVSGVIVDNNNKTVAQFASAHAGMGSFVLLPEEGKTYRARFKLKDSVLQTINLPKPATKGIALSVSTRPDKVSILIDVNHNFYQENENKNLTLAIYSGGQLTHVTSKLDSWELTLDLPISKFKTGIATFTVFNAAGQPLCERLAFIQNPADALTLAINTDKTTYTKRDKVQISLNAKNMVAETTPGHYSVSVIDEGKVPDAGYHNSILASLLLTADLKGYVEQPDYYFDNNTDKAKADLDVLLLTQGYRRFTWKQMLADSLPANQFQPEKSLEITGTVTSLDTKKPVINGTINLITPHGGPFLSQQTDNNGRFKFAGILFVNDTRFMFNATDASGAHDVQITLDPAKPGPLVNAPTTQGSLNTDMQTYVQNAQQLQAQKPLDDNYNGKLLKEVKVNALRSSNVVGSGHADQALDVTRIKTGGTLSEVLYGRLHGVRFMGNTPFLQGFNHGPMQIIVDGVYMPVPIPDENGVYNTTFNDINPNDVETVEVLKYANASIYGELAGNGVLLVTTKLGTGRMASTEKANGMLSVKPTGLYAAREFYTPKYEVASAQGKADLRSTIYWQPELLTDKNGNASFNFYNADSPGSYRVTVEGIDEAGHIGRAVYRYVVK